MSNSFKQRHAVCPEFGRQTAKCERVGFYLLRIVPFNLTRRICGCINPDFFQSNSYEGEGESLFDKDMEGQVW